MRTDGYIGVAGLGGGVTNVCVVHEIAADRVPPDQVIARAVSSDPELRDRFARARQISPVSSLGPLAVEAGAAGCTGLLLAGDAAGFRRSHDRRRPALRAARRRTGRRGRDVRASDGHARAPTALRCPAPRVFGEVANQPRPAQARRQSRRYSSRGGDIRLLGAACSIPDWRRR